MSDLIHQVISRRCGPGHEGHHGRNTEITAIMVVQVVGYAPLMGEDEASTVQAVCRCREAATPRASATDLQEHGRGLFARPELSTIVTAVECGVASQKMMAARNADTPSAERIVYRVNLGNMIDGADVLAAA
jgi:class 3 adenylate cyclase